MSMNRNDGVIGDSQKFCPSGKTGGITCAVWGSQSMTSKLSFQACIEDKGTGLGGLTGDPERYARGHAEACGLWENNHILHASLRA